MAYIRVTVISNHTCYTTHTQTHTHTHCTYSLHRICTTHTHVYVCMWINIHELFQCFTTHACYAGKYIHKLSWADIAWPSSADLHANTFGKIVPLLRIAGRTDMSGLSLSVLEPTFTFSYETFTFCWLAYYQILL